MKKIIITLCLMIGSITFAQNTDIATLEIMAKIGDAEAQFYLGVAYENGKGVEKSESQAVYWYRKAAEQDIAGAQHNLGVAYYIGVTYYIGEGMEQATQKAIYWLRKACNNQKDEACNLLNMIK